MTRSPFNSAPITPAGVSKETFSQRTGGPVRETRETARAVAAHLGFAAIGIVIAHPEIRAVRRRLEHENAVRADAAMPIAEARDLFAGQREIAGAIVEQDEIVARAIHFRETQHARLWLTYSRAKAKSCRGESHWPRLPAGRRCPPSRFEDPALPASCSDSSIDLPCVSSCFDLPCCGCANDLRAQLAPSPFNEIILQQIKKMPGGGKYSASRAATIRPPVSGAFRVGQVLHSA